MTSKFCSPRACFVYETGAEFTFAEQLAADDAKEGEPVWHCIDDTCGTYGTIVDGKLQPNYWPLVVLSAGGVAAAFGLVWLWKKSFRGLEEK